MTKSKAETFVILRRIEIDAIVYCKWCKQDKPSKAFAYQSYIRVDGTRILKTKCKECCNTYGQIYYRAHKSEHLKRGRSWNEQNRNRRRELDRARYARNPEAAKARHTDHNRRRRALKYVSKCESGITMDKVYLRDKGICGICKSICARKEASLDHIIALSNKGPHTWNNIQLAHFNCNAQKGNR